MGCGGADMDAAPEAGAFAGSATPSAKNVRIARTARISAENSAFRAEQKLSTKESPCNGRTMTRVPSSLHAVSSLKKTISWSRVAGGFQCTQKLPFGIFNPPFSRDLDPRSDYDDGCPKDAKTSWTPIDVFYPECQTVRRSDGTYVVNSALCAKKCEDERGNHRPSSQQVAGVCTGYSGRVEEVPLWCCKNIVSCG